MERERIPTPKTARRVTDDRARYLISVAAERAGVHPQTLRMWDRKGLLCPQRTEGRARRYSERDIEHIRMIQEMTQVRGMNLAGVEMVLRLTREIEDMQERLEAARPQVTTSLVPLRDIPRVLGDL
ncbi:MAG: MerR family transcriptional regulator [Actinomycetota bacterium]